MSHNSILPGPTEQDVFFLNALFCFRSYLVALVADLTEIFHGKERRRAPPLPVGVEVTPL